jgi:hypothetical protein
VPQARAALRRYKDVMEAAERIFEGQFDDVYDEDGDVQMDTARSSRGLQAARMVMCSAVDCAFASPDTGRRLRRMTIRKPSKTMKACIPTLPMCSDLQL